MCEKNNKIRSHLGHITEILGHTMKFVKIANTLLSVSLSFMQFYSKPYLVCLLPAQKAPSLGAFFYGYLSYYP